MKYILRKYQLDAAEAGVKSLTERKQGVLVCPSGSGKSLVIAEICHKLDEPVLILQPSREILLQNYEKLLSYGITDVGIYSASAGEKTIGKYTFCTIGSIYKKPELFKQFKYCCIDECFKGSTEILTEKGFQRFDTLDQNLKVAQYDIDNEQISFTSPTRYIKKEYDGEMISIKTTKNVDIDATANHEAIVTKLLSRNKREKIKFKDVKVSYKLPVAGEACGEDNTLTPLEKIYIALQADGNILNTYKKTRYTTKDRTPGNSTLLFSFSKERKILDLLTLLEQSNLDYKEIKTQPPRGNIKARRRWCVYNVPNASKNLWDNLSIDSLSFDKAKAIIDYMVKWDGSIISKTLCYYSSTVKANTDFYQAVSLLAGYKTNQITQVDNRKESYKDVHRLFINKSSREVGMQKTPIKKYNYNGLVYCVEVPKHNIVVRQNNKVLITGNCHMVAIKPKSMYNKFFKAIGDPSVIGLTATPFKNVQRFLRRQGNWMQYTGWCVAINRIKPFFFKSIAYKITHQELQDQGYLCPLEYQYADDAFDISLLDVNTTGAAFTDKSVEAYVQLPMNVTRVISAVADNYKQCKHILVFASSLAHSERLKEALKDVYDIDSETVPGTLAVKERKAILKRFTSGETKVVICVQTLSTGFDFPALDCVVLGRPTMSLNLYYQQINRGVRIAPGKSRCIIVDCCKNVKRFGRVETLRMGKEADGWRDTVVTETGVISSKPLFQWNCKIFDYKKKEPVQTNLL